MLMLNLTSQMSSLITKRGKKAGGTRLKTERSPWSLSCYTTAVESVCVAVS